MIDRITSRENPNVKDVIKIVKDKKYRDKYESFIVEGIRLCNEVIENNIGVKKVFIRKGLMKSLKMKLISL